MSEIKIKIGAELDIGAVQSELQGLVRDMERGAKFKVSTDGSGLKDIKGSFDSIKSQIERDGAKLKVDNTQALKKISEIEKEIGNVKDIKIKTTMDKDGSIDKINVQYKELDGTLKSISSKANATTGFFKDDRIDSTVKSMKEIDNSYDGQLSRASKLYGYEKKLQTLRDRSSKIKNKDSSEYKEAEASISRLESKTRDYQGTLQNVSNTDLKELNNEIKSVDNSTDKLWKTQQKMNREQKNVNAREIAQGFETTGRSMMALSTPLVLAGGASIKMAMDYETAFTGVRKTVSATEEEFQSMSDNFREMSKVMPQSASDIASVAEVAGQLGVKTASIEGFTETMIRLGDSTVLSSESAAQSIARFTNITGMSEDNVDRLGSSLVSLGNNSAANEEEILSLALGIAGVGKQVNMSEPDILGLSASLASVGIGAEKGGSALSKFLIEMQLSTEQGGESLENFAKVSGMSIEQFKQSFKEDSAGTFVSFIEGLQKIEQEGGSVLGTLDEMGISEVRLRDVILRAAGSADIFADSLRLGNSAFEENTALMDESNLRYETAESKLAMMKNRIVDVGIELGGALAPSVIDVADKVATLAESFGGLDTSTQASIVKFGAFTLAIGTGMSAFGKAIRGFTEVKGLLSNIGDLFTSTGTQVSAFTKLGGLMANPYVLGATAIVGAIALIGKKWSDHNKQLEAEAQAEKDRINDIYENYNEKQVNNTEALDFLKQNGDEYDRLNAKLGENRDLTNLTTQEQKRYHEIVEQMMNSGTLEGYYDDLGNAMSDSTEKANELTEALERQMAVNTAEMIRNKKDQMQNIQEEKEAIEATNDQEQQRLDLMKKQLETGKETRIVQGIHGSKTEEIELSDDAKKQLEQDIQDLELAIKADADFDEVLEKAKNVAKTMESEIFKDLDFAESLSGSMDGLRDEIFANNDDWVVAEEQATKVAYKAKEVAEALGKDFDTSTLKEYSTYLRDIGIGYDETIKSTSEMALITKGQEENMNAVNDAISQFTDNGTINAETVGQLSSLYGDLGISADMSGGQILGLLANHDQFLAGLIATEDVFKSLEQSQVSLGNSFKESSFELNMDNFSGFIEKIRSTKEESINEATQLKDGMLTALDGMEDILPPDAIQEAKDKIISDFTEVENRINNLEIKNINDLLQASMGDDKLTKALLDQFGEIDGYEFDEKEVKYIAKDEGIDAIEKRITNLNGIWKENPETKEYEFIEMGAEDVENAIATLNGVFAQDPETKEYTFIETGADGVITQTQATQMGWAWNPETKSFVSIDDGSEIVITGADGMKTSWAYDPKTKTFRAVENGISTTTGLMRSLKGAWDAIPNSATKTFITKYTTQGAPPPPIRKGGGIDLVGRQYTGTDSFQPNAYATGTKGGFGLSYVSELGQELLRYPNGQLELTGHDGAELRMLPRGTQVFNHMDTKGILDGTHKAPLENFNASKSGEFINQTKKKDDKKITPRAFASGNTKATKTSSGSKDTADFNDYRYLKWESALDRLDAKLDVMKKKEDAIFNDKDIIRSQEWQIKFFKQKQDLVHQTAQEMRKERDDLWGTLSSQGFKFSGSGDELMITNLNHIQGKSKEAEEALKRFYELQDKEIPSQQQHWWDYANSIKEVTAELDRFMNIEVNMDYIDADMAILQAREALAKSNKEIILLKKEEAKLNKEKQSNLHEHAQEIRKERDEIEAILKLRGVEFIGKGDDKRITNLKAIEGMEKQVLDLAQRYMTATSDMKGKSAEWLKIQSSINDIEVEEMSLQFELADRITNSLTSSMSELDYQMQLIGEDDIDKEFELTVHQLANMEVQAKETKAQIEALGENGFAKGSAQSNAFEERLAELNERLKENTISLKEYKKQLFDQRENKRSKWIDEQNRLYEEQQARLSDLASIQDTIVQIIRKRGEEEKKALDEAHKSEMDSLSKRHDERKKNYKDDLDLFRKTVQGKIDALDDQYEEEDYEEDLSKEQEKAREIQSEIDKLVMDDSIEARTRTIELRKDLAEQNEVIAKKQQRRERDLLKRSLQDQIKDEEEAVRDKEAISNDLYDNEKKRLEEDHKINKEFLDKKYSDEVVYAEAKEAIIKGQVEVSEGVFQDIFTAYQNFEDKFGKGMGIMGDIIKSEFVNKLEEARKEIKAMEEDMYKVFDKIDSDYQPPRGDGGIGDELGKWDDAIQGTDDSDIKNDAIDKIEGEVHSSKLQKYQDDFASAHRDNDYRGMMEANKNANNERGLGYIITANDAIANAMTKAFNQAERSLDWEGMIEANKSANELRTGRREVTATAPILRVLSEVYGKATNDGNWQLMEKVNRQANIIKGLGDVVTAQDHIESVKRKRGYPKYAQGGKDEEGGLAMLHGTKSKPEYIFNTPQFKDLAKLIAEHELTMPKANNVDISSDVANALNKFRSVSESIAKQQSIELTVGNLIKIDGNVDKDMLPRIKEEGDNAMDKLKNTLSKLGVTRSVR